MRVKFTWSVFGDEITVYVAMHVVFETEQALSARTIYPLLSVFTSYLFMVSLLLEHQWIG